MLPDDAVEHGPCGGGGAAGSGRREKGREEEGWEEGKVEEEGKGEGVEGKERGGLGVEGKGMVRNKGNKRRGGRRKRMRWNSKIWKR